MQPYRNRIFSNIRTEIAKTCPVARFHIAVATRFGRV
jgi:hypothetical protein